MPHHLALKRLTASDLTLFEALFRRLAKGNQKAINLNADVFIRQLYPAVPQAATGYPKGIPLPLSIWGPGGLGEHRLTRKITKSDTYKNWRLNGEFIPNPESEPARYNSLQAGDIAVLAFTGENLPAALDMVLLSGGAAPDAGLHASFGAVLGANRRNSMKAVSEAELAAAIEAADAPAEHPIHHILLDPALADALEDAALGGASGVQRLLRRRTGRSVAAGDLAQARLKAEQIGRAGEGLINAFLRQQLAGGAIRELEWSSEKNAVAPFDFRITDDTGRRISIDVKSTAGPFENELHISLGELIEAAESPDRYDLYRVSRLSEESGRLRIAADIRAFAATILERLNLPAGVRCDSVSVMPLACGMIWHDEFLVVRPAGDEDDS